MIAFAQHSQDEMRRLLLGDVSCRGEKPDDELQRALGVAHRIVAERGRGMEDLSLLMARAAVRLGSNMVELAEWQREERRRAGAAEIAEGERRVRHAAEVAELALQLAGARERIRTMMRQHAQVSSKQERAIELMLAMLGKTRHRISDHPEWILELGKLSGAGE